MEEKRYTILESPAGPLLLAGRGGALTDLRFGGARAVSRDPLWVRDDGAFAGIREQLDAYFRGELRRFSVRLAPEGTPFQLAAWRVLRRIPYGSTITYGEQARLMGRPGAARAAGGANRENPIAIIIPCHRVIGAGGRLTGFGGGLDLKRRLLELEGAAAAIR
ncbi:MAG: methylated-DNA--[protein]-cysteine S-methyltransferase [Candidatus Krumholzibacteria bacterium]|nr:methylated-DNA--[protein]-cysteine S-methyltransferase [Candidatus Krumholzibacteria bacterium]